MRRPSEAEILRLALEPDFDLEYQRTLRMTDEEIRENLRARGHDLRVLEAEADILWEMYGPKKNVRGGVLAGALAIMTFLGSVAASLGPYAAAVPIVLATTAAAAPPTPPPAETADAGVQP